MSSTGKRAPDKKKSGNIRKAEMTWNPSRLLKREPRASPIETSAIDVINNNSKASGMPQGFIDGNKNEKRKRTIICSVTSVHPPKTFPIKMLRRDTGATSMALSTSSLRSQTI